jgi:hypothetical protein
MAKKKELLPDNVEQVEVTEENPILITIGLARIKGGWSAIKLHTQGDKVIKAEMADPEQRVIAFETFKIWSVKEFMTKEV